MSEKQKKASAYWKENVGYLFILLTIWFIVSFGAGILFKESLVCTTRLNLCIRNTHIRLCSIDEQIRQKV
jgi:uncharacterized membrane protein